MANKDSINNNDGVENFGASSVQKQSGLSSPICFHTSSERHLADGGRWKGGKRKFPPSSADSPQAEVREYAFRVWRACNRDFSATERQIKKEDYCSVKRSTLSRWAKKYGWVERADSLDSKEEKAESVEQQVLDDLIKIHNKIMLYVDNQPIDEVDTAKINSLVNNAKQIADITGKIRKSKQEALLADDDKEQVQFNLKTV